MVVPPFHTPKWSFFARKPMGLLGKPTIFRKPPFTPEPCFVSAAAPPIMEALLLPAAQRALNKYVRGAMDSTETKWCGQRLVWDFLKSYLVGAWAWDFQLSLTKLVVSKLVLIFIPDPLGRWSNLTSIVQLGWNHQLVQALFGWCFEILFYLRFSAQAYQRQPCHSKGDMMIWSNLTIDTAYFSSGWLETTTKLFK